MSERQLSASERDAFFREHFRVDANGMVIETRKHSGGYPVSIDGRPVRSKAEYRAAHRALPPGPKRLSPAELDAWFASWRARIDELEAGATS
jgi:hypothetical protein